MRVCIVGIAVVKFLRLLRVGNYMMETQITTARRLVFRTPVFGAHVTLLITSEPAALENDTLMSLDAKLTSRQYPPVNTVPALHELLPLLPVLMLQSRRSPWSPWGVDMNRYQRQKNSWNHKYLLPEINKYNCNYNNRNQARNAFILIRSHLKSLRSLVSLISLIATRTLRSLCYRVSGRKWKEFNGIRGGH